MTFGGAVLTGGGSRRMGREKALIDVGGKPMARCVATALGGAGARPVVAVGGSAEVLAPLGMTVVADADPGAGPLGGVLSALGWFADNEPHTEWVVTAACDLPALTVVAVTTLTDAVRSLPHRSDVEVVVARSELLEPGLAVWKVSSLRSIRTIFDEGERALHRAILGLGHLPVQVDANALVNMNTPTDLARYPGAP